MHPTLARSLDVPVILVAAMAAAVSANPIVYDGPAGGGWADMANWDPDEIPDEGWGTSGPYDVSIISGVQVVMNHGGLFTPMTNVSSLTIGAGDELIVPTEQALRINVGPILNDGTIRIMPAGNHGVFNIGADAPVTLGGGGEIVFSGGPTWARLGGPSGVLVHESTHTIRGDGRLGGNELVLVNHGLIDADVPGGTLYVDLRAELPTNSTNDGIIRASNGGTLKFDGAFGEGIDNAGGVVRILDGSFAEIFNGHRFTHGLIETVGTGVIRPTYARWTDLSMDASVEIPPGGILWLSGAIVNDGVVDIDGTGALAYVGVSGDVDLSGTGEIVFDGPAATTSVLQFGNRLTQGAAHTMRGRGGIGNNAVDLTNHGLIRADHPVDPLTVNTRDVSGPLVNDGVMEAVGGATLAFINVTIDNTGGIIRATDGSTVELQDGVHVTGGELNTSGTGLIATKTGTLTDVTNLGAMEMVFTAVNLPQTTLVGTFMNEGTVEWMHRFVIDAAGVVFDGNGEIRFSGGPTISGYGGDVTNAPAHTLRGGVRMGAAFGVDAFLNQGTIVADDVEPFSLVLAETARNEGDITVANGSSARVGVLTNTTFFENAGSVSIEAGGLFKVDSEDYRQASGTTSVDGEFEMAGNRQFELLGGTLEGDGLVDAAVLNVGGTIAPGHSAGLLSIEGSFMQDGAGTLAIELGGAGRGDFDRLDVDGVATLGGTLDLALLNGFRPVIGQGFEIITADAIEGTFAAVVGGTYAVTYGASTVIVARRHPSDLDADNVVGPGDLAVLLGMWGSCPGCSADLDGDGVVGPADLAILLSNWGSVI